MTRQELTQRIVWDYNASSEEVYLCIKGRIPNALHFDRESLFRRMLENLGWYEIRDILELEEISGLLTEKVLSGIRSKELKKRYGYLKKLLSGEPLSISGWYPGDTPELEYPLLSNRWYSFKSSIL